MITGLASLGGYLPLSGTRWRRSILAKSYSAAEYVQILSFCFCHVKWTRDRHQQEVPMGIVKEARPDWTFIKAVSHPQISFAD